MQLHALGSFHTTTETLLIADPCFDLVTKDGRTTRESVDRFGARARVRVGTWHAFIGRKKTHVFGVRIAMLMIVHEAAHETRDSLKWFSSGVQVSVEGAQLGIWEWVRYAHSVRMFEGHKAFDAQCAAITRLDEMQVVMGMLHTLPPYPPMIDGKVTDEDAFGRVVAEREAKKHDAIREAYDQFLAAGTMECGVVCVPGLGDGVYNVEFAGAPDILGVRIHFLSEND